MSFKKLRKSSWFFYWFLSSDFPLTWLTENILWLVWAVFNISWWWFCTISVKPHLAPCWLICCWNATQSHMNRGCNRAKTEMSRWSMFETHFRRTINIMSVIHYLDILHFTHFPFYLPCIFPNMFPWGTYKNKTYTYKIKEIIYTHTRICMYVRISVCVYFWTVVKRKRRRNNNPFGTFTCRFN